MPRKYLRTCDLARAVGVHVNTVRRYLARGLLPPVERTPTGYRRFTQRHLDCLRLARLLLNPPYPGKAIFAAGFAVIHFAARDDLEGALRQAELYWELTRAEQAQADAAAAVMERWAAGEPVEHADEGLPPLSIGAAARRMGLSIDIVRSWDRNGLVDVPRDPRNGYRRYGAPELRRMRVIRMLSRAGYSLAAILRMLTQLDRGETGDLRRALDTPPPDEGIYIAADRWISTLAAHERCARQAIAQLEAMRHAPIA